MLTAGVTPFRPGEKGSGSDKDIVPLDGLTENFSSMLLIAPPPLGKEMAGASRRTPSSWGGSRSRLSRFRRGYSASCLYGDSWTRVEGTRLAVGSSRSSFRRTGGLKIDSQLSI